MVGHSERRAAGETDDDVARKVRAVADAGLVQVTRLKERLLQLGVREPHVFLRGHGERGQPRSVRRAAVLDGVGATRAGLEPATFLRMVDAVGHAPSRPQQ